MEDKIITPPTKEHHQFNMITSIIKLEEVLNNNVYKDELTGDVFMMGTEELNRLLKVLKRRVTQAFDVEMHNISNKAYKPIRCAINIMNKDYESGKLSKLQDDGDDSGEADMGETE